MEARRVTDRFEWAALAQLSPSFTHEWAWAIQCAERLHQVAFFRVTVSAVYLRVWSDDSLIGCPVLLMSADTITPPRVVNVPRSHPVKLSGPNGPNPAAAVSAAWPDLELFDDDHQHRLLVRLDRHLTRRSDRTVREWGLTTGTRNDIHRLASWPSRFERALWLSSFERVWRGPWQTSLTTHRVAGATIGWTGRIHRDGHEPELFAALAVGRPADPWVSPRVRQSSA